VVDKTVEDIEARIAQLKAKYTDLAARFVAGGSVDGGIAWQMHSVEAELRQEGRLLAKPRTVRGKSIVTRRDRDGNLVADVTEFEKVVADNTASKTMPAGWKGKSPIGDTMRSALPPGALKEAVTRGEMIDFVGSLADHNNKLSEYIASLLKRVKELEARPTLKYLGIWETEKVYASGSFVTDAGSIWHAHRANVGERPGTGDAWQLAVKKGKDAR
jgi:hypothetical protein